MIMIGDGYNTFWLSSESRSLAVKSYSITSSRWNGYQSTLKLLQVEVDNEDLNGARERSFKINWFGRIILEVNRMWPLLKLRNGVGLQNGTQHLGRFFLQMWALELWLVVYFITRWFQRPVTIDHWVSECEVSIKIKSNTRSKIIVVMAIIRHPRVRI